jgi:glycosyltransferase A (GT-A) superfamily protein (DUF2064 family)
MSTVLLLFAEASTSELSAGLALAEDWRRDIGNEAQWCWPAHLDLPAALGMAAVRKVPAGGNLGAALWLALCDALVRGETPLLLRLGHARLDFPQLQQARQLLSQNDAVFGTTATGDYALVGLARAVPELFAGIPWGGSQVMLATRTQARRHGCKLGELALAATVRA